MKITQINSFYYTRGGDCTHMFATTELLRKNGHEVHHFAMNHPMNFESPDDKYWPSYIDYREAIKDKSIKNIFRVIFRSIYSLEAKKCIDRFLDDVKPDLVHIHNILHHITPSILGEIKKRGIPIVWTLHDYTIICPNTSFLTENGDICEACKKRKFFMASVKRCKKNSLGASLVAMLENYVHRLMRVFRHVDFFISPSDFLRKKFVEYGMGQKVVTVNNFMDIADCVPCYENKDYYVYLGRLNHIKGVDTLVEAAKRVPEVVLKVVGVGELKEEFEKQNISNVEFVGFKSGEELKTLTQNAMFAVVPSQWYENFPYSVLEPMAYGKAVIGSRIGGIPELIKDGETGYLFEPHNVDELVSLIKKLSSNNGDIVRMGKNARARVEKEFNQKVHYDKLMEIYQKALNQ